MLQSCYVHVGFAAAGLWGLRATDLRRTCGVCCCRPGGCMLQICNVYVGCWCWLMGFVCYRAATYRWGVLLLAYGMCAVELLHVGGACCCWPVGCMLQSCNVHVGCAAAGLWGACCRATTYMWGVLLLDCEVLAAELLCAHASVLRCLHQCCQAQLRLCSGTCHRPTAHRSACCRAAARRRVLSCQDAAGALLL